MEQPSSRHRVARPMAVSKSMVRRNVLAAGGAPGTRIRLAKSTRGSSPTRRTRSGSSSSSTSKTEYPSPPRSLRYVCIVAMLMSAAVRTPVRAASTPGASTWLTKRVLSSPVTSTGTLSICEMRIRPPPSDSPITERRVPSASVMAISTVFGWCPVPSGISTKE